MAEQTGTSGPAAGDAERRVRVLLFAAWFAAVAAMSAAHAVWRDEMRALSFALRGDTVADMLRGLHGEGHPALWYLLLRAAYALGQDTVVLKLVAVGVAAAAVVVLLRWSPFRNWLVAVILLGRFMLFDYSVQARNYGISMLLMFVVAAVYPRWRDRGVGLGLLLALLANTNVASSLIVGAFLIFWLSETVAAHGWGWTPAMRRFAVNAGLAVLGVVLCAAEVYPPFNDAAAIEPAAVTPLRLLAAVVRPAGVFAQTVLYGPWEALGLGPVSAIPHAAALKWLLSAVIFGSLAGLIRRPAALVAGLAALVLNALFFISVYPGQYRHQALWLVFMIALYWIAAATPAAERRPRLDRVATTGFALFAVLLLLQIPGGVRALADLADDQPFSRSRDLAALLAARADLHRAVVIADPDYMVESLPYYRPNPTYLLREQRFGRTARFSVHTRRELSLDDILSAARSVASQAGRPVVILLERRLDPTKPAQRTPEGYNWTLVTTPAQVARFLAATTRLARFGPARSGESFDVYLLAAT